ncbi:hypothetical protein [Vibrio parahaemolyticus]|uniref:hypothetical protein n=1 Tax=Vibrio parahaemolyticus TaxID=670 RepID=UPI003D7D801C
MTKKVNGQITVSKPQKIILVSLIIFLGVLINCYGIKIDEGHQNRKEPDENYLVVAKPNSRTGYKGIDRYRVYTYASKEDCEAANSKTYSTYRQFRLSCDEIKQKADLFHNQFGNCGNNVVGFSIFKTNYLERYFPIYEGDEGDMIYLGGLPATYDFIEVSRGVTNDLGYDISTFNNVYAINGVE